MTDIEFFEGEIADVTSDVLIAPLHPTADWFGGTNGEIYGCAGEFHLAATAAKPLIDRQALFVPATKPHAGKFRDVIFVIDDLSRAIGELVAIGLREAEKNNLRTVTFPIFRTEVTAGIHPERNMSLRLELAAAVYEFVGAHKLRVTHITIVHSEKKAYLATKAS